MKKLISVFIIMALIFCGCSSSKTSGRKKKSHKAKSTKIEETAPNDYDELSDQSGTMLTVTRTSWSEVDLKEDFLIRTTYEINYDKTMTITKDYNLSETVISSFELSESDFMEIYGICYVAAHYGRYDDIAVEAVDGENFIFTYVEDGVEYEVYNGYAYGVEGIGQAVQIINSYT